MYPRRLSSACCDGDGWKYKSRSYLLLQGGKNYNSKKQIEPNNVQLILDFVCLWPMQTYYALEILLTSTRNFLLTFIIECLLSARSHNPPLVRPIFCLHYDMSLNTSITSPLHSPKHQRADINKTSVIFPLSHWLAAGQWDTKWIRCTWGLRTYTVRGRCFMGESFTTEPFLLQTACKGFHRKGCTVERL